MLAKLGPTKSFEMEELDRAAVPRRPNRGAPKVTHGELPARDPSASQCERAHLNGDDARCVQSHIRVRTSACTL